MLRAQIVHVGFACINRCIFCSQGQLREGEGRDRDPQTRAGIDGALAEGPGDIAFVGGEPTLHSELPAWIEYARRAGATSVVVQTNGRRLAYRAYVRGLIDMGADGFDISLHGPTAAIHDHHTRVGGGFEQTVTGIRNAVTSGVAVAVTMVVTRSNHRHLTEVVRLVASLGVRCLCFVLACSRGAAQTDFARVVPRIEAVRPHLGHALELGRGCNVQVLLSGGPLCMLPDAPEQVMLDPGAPPSSQGDGCTDCSLRQRCPGLAASYAERYGYGELRPSAAVLVDSVVPGGPLCGIGPMAPPGPRATRTGVLGAAISDFDGSRAVAGRDEERGPKRNREALAPFFAEIYTAAAEHDDG